MTVQPTTLDWAGLMDAGLRRLHLAPADFWALTPYELAVMLGQAAPPATLTRAGLAALLAQFPDAEKRDDTGPANRGA